MTGYIIYNGKGEIEDILPLSDSEKETILSTHLDWSLEFIDLEDEDVEDEDNEYYDDDDDE